MTVGRLADLVIRVEGAAALAGWYNRVLGMTEVENLDTNTWTAKYPGHSARLIFKVKEKEKGLGTKSTRID